MGRLDRLMNVNIIIDYLSVVVLIGNYIFY